LCGGGIAKAIKARRGFGDKVILFGASAVPGPFPALIELDVVSGCIYVVQFCPKNGHSGEDFDRHTQIGT
jgi:hypothetical protein